MIKYFCQHPDEPVIGEGANVESAYDDMCQQSNDRDYPSPTILQCSFYEGKEIKVEIRVKQVPEVKAPILPKNKKIS